MGAQKNREIVNWLVQEGFIEGNLSLFDEYVAEDFVDHSAPPGLPPGREGVKELARMFRRAFPDYRTVVEDEIAEGDKVVHRARTSGTHQGEFLGIPPTGKRAEWTEMHIVRLRDGKIVEHWGEVDQLGMMQQLGVVPEPEELAGS